MFKPKQPVTYEESGEMMYKKFIFSSRGSSLKGKGYFAILCPESKTPWKLFDECSYNE